MKSGYKASFGIVKARNQTICFVLLHKTDKASPSHSDGQPAAQDLTAVRIPENSHPLELTTWRVSMLSPCTFFQKILGDEYGQ